MTMPESEMAITAKHVAYQTEKTEWWKSLRFRTYNWPQVKFMEL